MIPATATSNAQRARPPCITQRCARRAIVIAMRVLNDYSRPTVGAADASSSSVPPLLVTPAAAAGMAGEVQLQPAASGAAAGSNAGFNTDMVIVLAALLCVLVCALGLNSLIHHCFVLDFGRATTTLTTVAAPAAAAAATGTAGLKKRELRRIPVVVYEARPGASATDCAICLGEFDDGERVRVLPRCHHGFHVQCIDLWLATHPSCPTCRNSLLVRQGRRRSGDDGDGEATTTVAPGEGT